MNTEKLVKKVNKIDNIEEQLDNIETQKADKTTTVSLQGQINNLVLGAVGDGNNAEVVQARGEFNILNERLNNIENSENIKFGEYNEDITSVIVKNSGVNPRRIWNSSLAPFYYTDNSLLKGKYITKIAFKVETANTPFNLAFKFANEYTDISNGDQTVDGIFCTITPTDTNWNEYDLTKADGRIKFNVPYDKGIYIDSNVILAMGTKDDGCTVKFGDSSTDSIFWSPSTENISYDPLSFIISVKDSSIATDVVKINNGLLNKFNKDINDINYSINGGTTGNLFTLKNSIGGGYYNCTTLSWVDNTNVTQLGFITLPKNIKSIILKVPIAKISKEHHYVFKNSQGVIFSGGKTVNVETVTIQVPSGATSFSSAIYTSYPIELYFNLNSFYEIINNDNDLIGKNISILGDSISTYVGYVPTGNEVFYNGSNGEITDVSLTWWQSLITSLGLNLCLNNSWSGSRVTTTGGDESAGCMSRCENLHNDTTNPDIIMVYIGINDFNNNVQIGSYNGSQSFPTTTTTFREAYAIMLNKILTKYVNAKVYVCTLPYCDRNTDENEFPEKNGNGVTLAEWNNAIRELADLFGVDIIEFSKCGITFQNRKTFLFDELHPNPLGMKMLKNKAEKTIKYS